MHEPSRRKLLSLAALAPFAGGLLAKSAAASNVPQPAAPSPRERIHQTYFPDVTLINQDNQPVRFFEERVKDKAVTINFFYAQCDRICPVVMANLAKVQKLLGDKVGRELFMSSISLRPETDTPEVLKSYAQAHNAQPGWEYLTGKAEDIEKLRRSLGFTNPDPRLDKDIEQHIGNIRYGNEPYMLWAACPGQASAEWIAESVSWIIHPEEAKAKLRQG
jgi:protein SCO1/2